MGYEGAVSRVTSTGWYPVARSAEVGTTPVPVGAGGRAFVVVRLRPGGEVSAFPARCPHRLVPLAAATVTDGRLQCPYHGWRFDAEGRCVDIPSLGSDGTPPPRADLPVPWAVEERHGWIWLAPDRTTTPTPPRPSATPTPEAAPAPQPPAGPLFDNTHPSLEHAWHPVALSRELRPGGWLQVRLLGRTWTVRRTSDGLTADPPAFGVREGMGLVWLAPDDPVDLRLESPEVFDRRFVSGWLPPVRCAGPAGPLADALLDTSHVPFLHGGPAEPQVVDLVEEPGGFHAVQEYEPPADGSPRTGERRRLVVGYRAPFQLRLRQELPKAGIVSTALFLLQPEDLDSTRVHVRVLLSAGPGRPLPAPSAVVEEMAFVHRMLEEDVALLARTGTTGLPLDVRQELHVPADRLGVALRRALSDVATAGRTPAAACERTPLPPTTRTLGAGPCRGAISPR
jgi:phenylpropionate dioxygenase-like ring-hydroxylating dioxygenase large terminal subunit